MNLLIGKENLEVTNCWVERYESGKLVMKVIVPESNITYEELENLFKENTEDMALEKEEGVVEVLSGFHYSVRISKETDVSEDESEVGSHYFCEVECVGENEYQIGRLYAQLSEQYNVNVALANELEETKNELEATKNEITELQLAFCDLYETMA